MNTLFRTCLCLTFAGCLSTADVSDPGADTSTGESHLNAGPMPTLPYAGGSGSTAPWGGNDSSNWRPEAVLANATSEALNTAWAMGAVKDVRVAVPVKLLDSGFNEFGDGQANAAPSFEWWSEKRPPVVATLVQLTDGTARIVFRFDRSLRTAPDWELRYNGTTVTLTTTTTSAGDFTVTWSVPQDLDLSSTLSTQALLVHPVGWRDWFPLWFRIPVRGVNDLIATVPSSMRTFSSDQGSLVDHESVSSSANKNDGQTPYQRLTSRTLSSAYNQQPFNPGDIHAVFPWNGQTYVTGIGAGWTWVASQPPAPFKVMYTCFQRRQPSAEASAPNGGVPSGGGWHRIGDPAETILNDLEAGPLVVGSGMNQPYTDAVPNGGGFAYNLSDVAVIRWLQPGEAFITRRGSGAHENYHWYYFSQSTEVCTEEWVHPTVPDDAYDFAPPSVNVTFQVDNAVTSWGQNVFVVGDAPELGSWDSAHAVPLSPTAYPTWTGTLGLSKGKTVQFKFLKKDGAGNVTWENGANRSLDIGQSDTSYAGSWQ
jgi:hypothetical protein